MVKPTLLVLAAGMGSRYGSLKQMDGVGPNNEAIIDYSIYDAIQAGSVTISSRNSGRFSRRSVSGGRSMLRLCSRSWSIFPMVFRFRRAG